MNLLLPELMDQPSSSSMQQQQLQSQPVSNEPGLPQQQQQPFVPNNDYIPLPIIIEYLCQKVYTDLTRLVDLLPSKTDIEKKIEIATFFSRTRHLFIRLDALIKWSSNASKVDKCEKISNFLDEQSRLIVNTANSLASLVRETLVGARLPPFAVLLAVDVLTNHTYTCLPKSIKNSVIPHDPITAQELSQALLDINRVIQNWLSLTQLPRQFRSIDIGNGRVRFVVPHGFSVTLTLLSEALDFPWRILKVKFLVREPTSDADDLVHPAQEQFILSQAQSRLLYRNFDKRPPLIHLYDMLHAFSLSLQLDVLYSQALRARLRRPLDQFLIEAYKPGASLSISYWHQTRPTTDAQSADAKAPCAYLITIHVDELDPQRPLAVTHQPPMPADQLHQVGTVIRGNELSLEKLFSRTIAARIEDILKNVRQELLTLCPGGQLRLTRQPPFCLYLPILWPCQLGECLQLTVHSSTGLVQSSFSLLTSSHACDVLPSSGSNGPSQSLVKSSLTCIEQSLNRLLVLRRNWRLHGPNNSLLMHRSSHTGPHRELVTSLGHLRVCLAMIRLSRTAQLLRPYWQSVKRTLPVSTTTNSSKHSRRSADDQLNAFLSSSQSTNSISTSGLLYIQLLASNDYYLACRVDLKGLGVNYSYALLTCKPISAAIGTSSLSTSSNAPQVDLAGLVKPDAVSMFLQLTHFEPLDLDGEGGGGDRQTPLLSPRWANNSVMSLSLFHRTIVAAKQRRATAQLSRLDALLARIKQKQQQGLGVAGENLSQPLSVTTDQQQKSLADRTPVQPTWIVGQLCRTLGLLDETIMTNSVVVQLSRAGIVHSGLKHDGANCLSAIELYSIPSPKLTWQSPNLVPLSKLVHRATLRPLFGNLCQPHSIDAKRWQLDLTFTGFDGNRRRYQHLTAGEWAVSRLQDASGLVHGSLIGEWHRLCQMHALCYPVVNDPGNHLPSGVELVSYNLETMCLKYAASFLVFISCRANCGFTLSFGFDPLSRPQQKRPTAVQPKKESGQWSSWLSSSALPDIDSNPHSACQHQLEDLVKSVKSIKSLTETLMRTLPFLCTVQALRDPILLHNGLKTLFQSSSSVASACPPPVRGMTLITYSPSALLLVYRGTLAICLHQTEGAFVHLYDGLSQLNAAAVNSASPLPTGAFDRQQSANQIESSLCQSATSEAAASQSPVVESDLLCQLLQQATSPIGYGGGGQSPNSSVLPLPSFQRFNSSLRTKYPNAASKDAAASSWPGLTASQLIRLLLGPHTTDDGNDQPPSHSASSPLTGYLAASLLFHAVHAFVRALGALSSQLATASTINESGQLNASWPTCSLTSLVAMVDEDEDAWRLKLTLTPLTTTTLSMDSLTLLEEFFHVRVCNTSMPQPGAVASFFSLLLLPPGPLMSVARLIDFDLHPPDHAPLYMRLGLVTVSTSSTTGQQQDITAGSPGIVVHSPRIILQLLVMRTPAYQHQSLKSSSSPSSLAQLITVQYDWATNRVLILAPPPSSSQASPNKTASQSSLLLHSLLRDTDVEGKANAMASHASSTSSSSPDDSALVQLALLITQTLAATYYNRQAVV